MTQVVAHELNADAGTPRQDESGPRRTITGKVAIGLLIPMFALFVLGFVIPLGTVAKFSFDDFSSGSGQTSAFGLSQYSAVLSSGNDTAAILRTFELSLITVIISALLAYPLALAITRGPVWARLPLMAAVLAPLLVSVVVKTFGWTVLLGRTAFPQRVLDDLHIPVKLLFSETGVTIGLIHTYMPFMALSLIAALSSIDRRTEEAAASLGSSPVRVFFTVTFPQSINGLVAGSVLTFAASMSALVTPQLLGGGRVSTVVTSIYRQIETAQNFPYAAALGIILLAATLVILLLQGWLMGRRRND